MQYITEKVVIIFQVLRVKYSLSITCTHLISIYYCWTGSTFDVSHEALFHVLWYGSFNSIVHFTF